MLRPLLLNENVNAYYFPQRSLNRQQVSEEILVLYTCSQCKYVYNRRRCNVSVYTYRANRLISTPFSAGSPRLSPLPSRRPSPRRNVTYVRSQISRGSSFVIFQLNLILKVGTVARELSSFFLSIIVPSALI